MLKFFEKTIKFKYIKKPLIIKKIYNNQDFFKIAIYTKLGKIFFNFPKNVIIKIYMKKNKINIIKIKTKKKKKNNIYLWYNLLNNFLFSAFGGYIIKLNLKGRGYNINLTKQKNILELKIGFSHIIRLYLPNIILLKKINKLDIYIFSIYYNDLKNFATIIKNIKNLDNYKAKGFFYDKEKIKLKEGKKKY